MFESESFTIWTTWDILHLYTPYSDKEQNLFYQKNLGKSNEGGTGRSKVELHYATMGYNLVKLPKNNQKLIKEDLHL